MRSKACDVAWASKACDAAYERSWHVAHSVKVGFLVQNSSRTLQIESCECLQPYFRKPGESSGVQHGGLACWRRSRVAEAVDASADPTYCLSLCHKGARERERWNWLLNLCRMCFTERTCWRADGLGSLVWRIKIIIQEYREIYLHYCLSSWSVLDNSFCRVCMWDSTVHDMVIVEVGEFALKERRLWNWLSYLMLLCRYNGSSQYSQPVFRFDGKFVCSVLRMAAGGHHTCFIYGTYTPPTYIVTSHLHVWSLQKLPITHPTKKHTNAHTKP
jgi:hypothetical protein